MAGLYVFVECAQCLQSLFQQNETNVSLREIARLIARNPLKISQQYIGMLTNNGELYEMPQNAAPLCCTDNEIVGRDIATSVNSIILQN